MIPIDQIIRSRRKTIALTVEFDGRLTVRAPLRARDEYIRRLVEQKEDWIRSKQELTRGKPVFAPKRYVEGETFWYLGERHPLYMVEQNAPRLELNGGFRLARLAQPRAAALFQRWYKQQALRIITERVQHFALQHGFAYRAMKITSARTRWGSCSSRGTLSFAWRLVMAPPAVIDYVVLHELAHLKIHNHSPKFWSSLERLLPDYREKKKWLDQNGHLLRLE
jgi:predicted metal-dependent hydrolase